MLVAKAFYLNGQHVVPGEQVAMDTDDTLGTMRAGLAAPIRLVQEDGA
jgi:hypothetical protein